MYRLRRSSMLLRMGLLVTAPLLAHDMWIEPMTFSPQTGEIVEVKLTKESQIRMCGNSVCPDVAEALVRANNPEMAVFSKEERSLDRRKLAAA